MLLSFFFLLKETKKQTTNKHKIPPGGFGTKDCMIFLLKVEVEAPEREKKKMSQSPIDFLVILIVIKKFLYCSS